MRGVATKALVIVLAVVTASVGLLACGSGPSAAADAGSLDAAPDVALPTDPIVVVSGADYPYGLAVDDQYVYFTSVGAGTVSRVPKLGGGAAEVLASGLNNPHRLAADDSFLYVVVWGTPDTYLDGQIVRVPKSGGAAQPIATNLHRASGVAVSGSDVWFANAGTVTGGHYEGDGTLGRVPKDGSSAPEMLLTAENYPALLAVDEASVYLTARYSGLVVRCDKVDCARTRRTLYSGLDEPIGIALSGSALVFTEYHGGRVLAGDTHGVGFLTLASSRGMPADIVTDGVTAYWGEELTRDISFEPIAPDILWSTLAIADKDPNCLVIDAHAVYYSDETAGTITRLPR